jgi:hypothetical protein
MQEGWHDFDIWRERQRGILGEAEARRLVRGVRPNWRGRFGRYLGLLDRFSARILGLGGEVISSHRAFPPNEEVAPSAAGSGLVEAQVRSSSVIEFHQEEEAYVIREVDLGTGDDILYLSTEEPEWAAWLWERKIHG